MEVKEKFENVVNSIQNDLKLLNDFGFSIEEYVNYFECRGELLDDDIEDVIIYNSINKYKKFIFEYKLVLDNIKFFDLINEYMKQIDSIDEETIEKCVNKIVKSLDDIKSSDFFVMDEATKFIGFVYDTSYKFMKLEFLINGKSQIYDYFIRDNHDKIYLYLFVKSDIEDIRSSINYIPCLECINEIVKDKGEDVLDVNLLFYLSSYSFPNVVDLIFEGPILKIRDDLKEIDEKVKDNSLSGKQPSDFFERICSLSLCAINVNLLEKDYNEIISKYWYLVCFKNDLIKEIGEYFKSLNFPLSEWIIDDDIRKKQR